MNKILFFILGISNILAAEKIIDEQIHDLYKIVEDEKLYQDYNDFQEQVVKFCTASKKKWEEKYNHADKNSQSEIRKIYNCWVNREKAAINLKNYLYLKDGLTYILEQEYLGEVLLQVESALEAYKLTEPEIDVLNNRYKDKKEFWKSLNIEIFIKSFRKKIKTEHCEAQHKQSSAANYLGSSWGISLKGLNESLMRKTERLMKTGGLMDDADPWDVVFTEGHQSLADKYIKDNIIPSVIKNVPNPRSETHKEFYKTNSDDRNQKGEVIVKRSSLVKGLQALLNIDDLKVINAI